ncbi:MAG: hypothetical protein ABII81_11410 [Pseudomonadota bacterium]
MLKKLLSILLLSFMAACQSLPDATIIMVDEDHLEDVIEVNNVQSGRTSTGTLRVWGELKNLTDKRVLIEVRAAFRGDDKRVVEKAGGWTRIFIDPNSTQDLELLSTVNDASEFLLEVREGKQ